MMRLKPHLSTHQPSSVFWTSNISSRQDCCMALLLLPGLSCMPHSILAMIHVSASKTHSPCQTAGQHRIMPSSSLWPLIQVRDCMESTNHNWLLLFRTSQCCRQAESDINTAGHIPLDTLEPCAAFEQRRHCPGYQPIQSQVKEAQDSIEATKIGRAHV